jgi:hypothetical protein
MRRALPAAALFPILVVVFLAACSSPTGLGVPFQLYTHCGIRYADFDGRRFYADPPLDDGNGNPPRGWGNPYDNGTMKLIDKNTAVFSDAAGHRAVFSTQPKTGIPTIGLCS